MLALRSLSCESFSANSACDISTHRQSYDHESSLKSQAQYKYYPWHLGANAYCSFLRHIFENPKRNTSMILGTWGLMPIALFQDIFMTRANDIIRLESLQAEYWFLAGCLVPA